MLRSLAVIAVILCGTLEGAAAFAAPHPVMDRLGHGLSRGLHRLGHGLHNVTHPHHRYYTRHHHR